MEELHSNPVDGQKITENTWWNGKIYELGKKYDNTSEEGRRTRFFVSFSIVIKGEWMEKNTQNPKK